MINNNPVLIEGQIYGHLPISIATALAIQRLFGMDDNGDKSGNYKNQSKGVTDLWINLSTIARNFIFSFPEGLGLNSNEQTLARMFVSEIEKIVDVVKYIQPRINVTLYLAEHDRLQTRFPHAKLRVPSTTNQHRYKVVSGYLLSVVRDNLKAGNLEFPHVLFKNEIESTKVLGGKTVILTHEAIDLLSRLYFGGLAILESHTGLVKPRALWHTKLYKGQPLVNVPFNATTLSIYGDASTFAPQSSTLRDAVTQLAIRKGWSAITPEDTVKRSLKELKPYNDYVADRD